MFFRTVILFIAYLFLFCKNPVDPVIPVISEGKYLYNNSEYMRSETLYLNHDGYFLSNCDCPGLLMSVRGQWKQEGSMLCFTGRQVYGFSGWEDIVDLKDTVRNITDSSFDFRMGEGFYFTYRKEKS
jgi:hypothetical protein